MFCFVMFGDIQFEVLKNKIQPSKLEDLIVFMNQAVCQKATQECTKDLYNMEGFQRQKYGGTRNLKEWIISGKSLSLRGSIRQVTPLVPTKKFQTVCLQFHSKDRLTLQLGQRIKSWWGLSKVISFGIYCLFVLSRREMITEMFQNEKKREKYFKMSKIEHENILIKLHLNLKENTLEKWSSVSFFLFASSEH